MKKHKRNKRKRLPTLKSLKTKADKFLSLHVMAVTISEFGLCPLCNKNPIQCCFHFIRRRVGKGILRWDVRDTIGACHPCNFVERYNPDLSRAWFIRKYGVDLYLELVDESQKPFKATRDFLNAIIAYYEPKVSCP